MEVHDLRQQFFYFCISKAYDTAQFLMPFFTPDIIATSFLPAIFRRVAFESLLGQGDENRPLSSVPLSYARIENNCSLSLLPQFYHLVPCRTARKSLMENQLMSAGFRQILLLS
jgi:hypothetical protein